jgi:hypothetical protein
MGLTNQPREFIGIKQEVMVYKCVYIYIYRVPSEYDVLQGAPVC